MAAVATAKMERLDAPVVLESLITEQNRSLWGRLASGPQVIVYGAFLMVCFLALAFFPRDYPVTNCTLS